MKNAEWIYGYHALHAAIKTRPELLQQIYLQSKRQDERSKNILNLAQQVGVPIDVISRRDLNDIIEKDVPHQGMAAILKNRLHYIEADLEDLITVAENPLLLLILDGVQDPHNLGACLRTANAAGVHAVIAPKDRAVGLTPVVRKVASGAADITPFYQVTNLARTLRDIQKRGIWIHGTSDQGEKTIFEADFTGSIAVVLGSEGKGMRRLTTDCCDATWSIPMSGSVSSLNVSVAAGVCLFEALRQRL